MNRHRISICLFGSLIAWLAIPALALAEIEAKPVESGGYLFRLIAGADPVVKLVLLILLVMSVFCWAIIFYKYKEIKRSTRHADRFFDLFWRTGSLEDLVAKSSGPPNPLKSIFRKSIADLLRKKREEPTHREPTIGRLQQQIDRAREDEIAKIERYIPFLATTGSSAPYIGMFGTVWGILAAFWEIGQAGTSSLAVVGPYIAEALIATAMGLAAAIPAVIFYNYFVVRIRTFERNIDSFSEDLMDRINREFFAGT